MSGWEGTWWKKKGGKRLKKKRGKKADKDCLLPPVLLSSWPKAHPEPAAIDDITVWDTTGRRRGLWLLFVTLATGPLVLGASVRASQCCAVIASPLSLSLPPILFYFLSLAFSFPAPLGAFWKSWFFFSILCYFFFAKVLTNSKIVNLQIPMSTFFFLLHFTLVRESFFHYFPLLVPPFCLLSSSLLFSVFTGVHRKWIGSLPT